MVDFSKIKLVIWDLDDTFWNGIISEQNVFIEERNIELIKTLTDCGIINTICSKNDFEVVKNKLSETDLWDYFVFSSINWESKGIRVKQIIEDMCLRPANVLFIDDNDMNLNEALYFCPELMISSPDVINDLYMFAKSANKSDLQHKRLKQYKLLEKKQELRNEFSNNEEFLLSCNIQVVIKNDCMKCVDRLHELVMRSNQLNYTKNRQSIEDFTNLISDKSVNSGYVEVSDKFGDYGIVGFYAIKDNELIHFAFSCRTLGMKVEQWVYAQIGYPKLKVVAEVASALENNFSPSWINNIKLNSRSDQAVISDLILFKGSCDMLQLFTFIKKTPNIKTEFTYVNKLGQTMMGQNHTSQILTSLLCDDAKKNQIIAEVPFLDNNSLTTSIATIKYKYIFLSLLIDGTLGVYKRRESGECISELEDYYPLTYKENFNLYINQQIYTGNNIFTQESLQQFSSKYEYVDTSNAKITIENLKKIREIIPKE
ncbi:MAG: HAD-IIIC family phosphatase, partial [Bacillota bacterium]|nr:HAD-IIIC family phosphatase [Bacillota bacterium]